MLQNKQEIRKQLKSFINDTQHIDAVGLMTGDGLPIDSILKDEINEDRLSALSASLLSLAYRTGQEFNQGSLKQVVIDNEEGFVLMLKVGNGAVLSVITEKTSKLGMLLFDSRKLASNISPLVQ